MKKVSVTYREQQESDPTFFINVKRLSEETDFVVLNMKGLPDEDYKVYISIRAIKYMEVRDE